MNSKPRIYSKMVTFASTGKVNATVFWSCWGIVFIDYLEKDEFITDAYSELLLDTLINKLQEKSPVALAHNKVPSHSISHSFAVVLSKLIDLSSNLFNVPSARRIRLSHTTYSSPL